MFAYKAAKVD